MIEVSEELAIIRAAPILEHPRLVLGLRNLIQAFRWTAIEVRGVALTADEAAWLAGYCAFGDAPMARQSPV